MTRKLLLLFGLMLASAGPAWADDDFRYALGVVLKNEPENPGADVRQTRLKPVWALRWGRLRISTGGGSGLLGFGSEVYGPGASADLLTTDKLRLGVALRFDGGRDSGDARSTNGLPNIRRTLRGRFFASYAITPDLRWTNSLSQDLLGRGGGLVFSTDMSYRILRRSFDEWSVGAGLNATNGTYMRSYFGIRPEDVQTTGLPAYVPAAGVRDFWLGTSYTHALSKRWITQANAGVSHLVGPAANSPLTVKPTGVSVSISLAYRN
ncbi:MipA/OmpV family protein [Burkholderiaceae bacterium UC74_6]